MERQCDSCMMSPSKCPALNSDIAKKSGLNGIAPSDICDATYESKEANDKGLTLIEAIVAIVIISTIIISCLGVGGGCSIFFQKEISGVVINNQALGTGQAGWLSTRDAKEIAFSRAIDIQTTDGQDIVFSTIDRQFSVVKPNDCVKVRIFQYPPWNLTKAGTFYNGRLLHKWQCTKSEQ